MEKSDQQPEPERTQCTLLEMRNLRHALVHDIGGYQERKFDQEPMPPSKLLGLPAELRNRIYELLVDTGDLDTARPRILQICKQIYIEASSILYSSNTFKIVISSQGVKAQGVRCGAYAPNRSRDITKLEWPAFIAKAETLDITTEDLDKCFSRRIETKYAEEHGCHYRHGGSLSIVNNVLFSLGLYINAAPAIPRALTVDLDPADTPGAVIAAGDEYCTCLVEALRPLNLIAAGSVVHAHATDDDDYEARCDVLGALFDDGWPEDAQDARPDLLRWQALTKKAELCVELRDSLGNLSICLQKDTRRRLREASKTLRHIQRHLPVRQPLFIDNQISWWAAIYVEHLEDAIGELRMEDLRHQASEASVDATQKFQRFQNLLDKMDD